jgi:hypothetical protein
MRQMGGTSRIAATLLMAVVLARAPAAEQSVSAPGLTAAFLFNFAQFVEWPAHIVPPGADLVLCVVDDATVAGALEQTIKGRTVLGHQPVVKYVKSGAPLADCHVLYLAGPDLKRALDAIGPVKGLCVFTVSDAGRFAETGGMVELIKDNGKMRFAVNMDALQRGGVRLSSRVLVLAKIVRDADSP